MSSIQLQPDGNKNWSSARIFFWILAGRYCFRKFMPDFQVKSLQIQVYHNPSQHYILLR